MPKRISLVGIVGVPANYGGFETFAEYLSRYIDDDFELTVYCSGKGVTDKRAVFEKAKLKYIPLKATGVQSVPYDVICLMDSLFACDVMLVLGSSGALILPLIKLFSSKKIVFNMAGLEWKRSKWNRFAKSFLKWSEKIAVKYSDVIVVDNRGLQEYIMDEYGVNSEVIAYGGDQVSKRVLSADLTTQYPFLSQPYYAAVARVQPDNNIDLILEAFKTLPDKQIVFVGNWDASEYGLNLKVKYHKFENLHLLSPIYDLTVLDQIRSNCIGYIHGHSSGGTNPSLVEAMHLEIPIYAFDINFNRYTTQGLAFYFSDASQLRDVLKNGTSEMKAMSIIKMKELAQESYCWRSIVEQYEAVF